MRFIVDSLPVYKQRPFLYRFVLVFIGVTLIVVIKRYPSVDAKK